MVRVGVMCLLWGFSSWCWAASSVWSVSKGENKLFIGGTIHVLSPKDHPLPKEFGKAYEQSSTLVLEVDVGKSSTPQAQMQMMSALISTDGATLESKLKPQTLEALKRYLHTQGLSYPPFANYTASGISLVLVMAAYQGAGMVPKYGVDFTFWQLANNDKKTLVALETFEQQVGFIGSMALGNEDAVVAHTVRDIERLPQMLPRLKKAWRTGDLKASNALLLDEIKRDYPQVYKALVLNRNNAWMPKIEQMLLDAPVEFILVGALHLAGDDGLIKQLERKGYKVDRL